MAGYTHERYQPVYVGMTPKAFQAYQLLLKAIDEDPIYPCLNNPYFYTDYDGLGLETENHSGRVSISDDDAEALCYGCPLIKQCYDYAVAADMDDGIWGGINFATQDKLF